MKIHLKLKSRAICGAKTRKRPLRFASDAEGATCLRCKKAVER